MVAQFPDLDLAFLDEELEVKDEAALKAEGNVDPSALAT